LTTPRLPQISRIAAALGLRRGIKAMYRHAIRELERKFLDKAGDWDSNQEQHLLL
jgi:hypothetical protein